jgi:Rrf2 family protein
MLELASNGGEPALVQVKAIAEAHGIPSRFLVQILLQLKGHGLVRSIRGAAGGYQLARRAELISLADIIHAIDRAPEAGAPRIKTRKQSHGVDAVASVLQELAAREKQMLREITLADLVRRSEQSNLPTYQI